MSISTRPDMTPAARRTADALRTAADEIADWTSSHETPLAADRAVDRAADWGRATARRIEDEPARHVAYEAQRQLRRRPWIVPVTAVSVTALAFAVAAVLKSRRRRAERAQQLRDER